MPELTPEYIASITEAELRAAGYHVRQITSYRFEEPFPTAVLDFVYVEQGDGGFR